MTLNRRKLIRTVGPGSLMLVSVCLSLVIVGFLFTSPGAAQVIIKKPRHLDVPEQRVQVLHQIICGVVAEEFHIRGGKVGGPVTLLLGEEPQRTVVDELNGTFNIYLKEWDEVAFAISDTELTVQRMLSKDRFERIAREVIRRLNETAPVNVDALRKE